MPARYTQLIYRLRGGISRLFWTVGWRIIGPVVNYIFLSKLILKTDAFNTTTWLGKPILQNVIDLWTIQETIYELKPALIVETGTNKGGSSFFYAQLFDLMATDGRIVTIDVAKLHDFSHPRVRYLIGDSASPAIVDQVRQLAAACGGPVFVILDSDHSQPHVERELELYAPLATSGSYVLVQDGSVDTVGHFKALRPGPLPAIHAFLARHPEFTIDRERCERFLITHHPDGWLKRA
jgi:cephalosporin hydroxylase